MYNEVLNDSLVRNRSHHTIHGLSTFFVLRRVLFHFLQALLNRRNNGINFAYVVWHHSHVDTLVVRVLFQVKSSRIHCISEQVGTKIHTAERYKSRFWLSHQF